MAKPSGRQKEPAPEGDEGVWPRFVAIHPDVVLCMLEWQNLKGYDRVVPRLINLMRKLLSGSLSEINIALRQLESEKLQSGFKLWELGLNQRGGAPRVILFRGGPSAFFVAAGVEKGSSGCREIARAVEREGLVLAQKMPTTMRDVCTLWGGMYRNFR